MSNKPDYYQNFEKDNRESRTFEQVKKAYDKLQEILGDDASKVFITGGIAPYLLLNRDSGRLHDDIDGACLMPDITMLREVFKGTPYYKAEWDSLTYNKEGIDYGFEVMIEDVPCGICTIEHKEGKMYIVRSFDQYTKEMKYHELSIENFNDYITEYEGVDGRIYHMTTLEYIKKCKDTVRRPKDIVDSKIIEEIGYNPDIYDRIVVPQIQFNKEGKDGFEETKRNLPISESKFAQIYEKSRGRMQKVFSKIKSFIKGRSQEKDNQNISNR